MVILADEQYATMELGESHLLPYVNRWRAQLADLPDEGYRALVDAISRRQARRIGVAVDDWVGVGDEELARAEALVDEVERVALWDEAHTLGWFHQHFGEPERDASNRAHDREEAKHASQTVTTQLYTPRWIADFLATACLEVTRVDAPTVCDPAVGGGQMLLAALDALVARGASVEDAATRLYGVDLDPRALEAARRALSLEAARRLGRRSPHAEAAIAANLRVADGLFDELGTYDVVLTNPPYMGARSMPEALKERIREHFRPFHADLYTAFIRRCHALSRDVVGVLAQQTVWFLSRFRKARAWLLDEAELVEFMHLGAHAFVNLNGEKASVVAFVQAKHVRARDGLTRFIDLRQFPNADAKRRAFRERPDEVSRREPARAFDALPGRVLAHWLPGRLRRHFATTRTLGDIADIPGSQNKTGKNRRYVKHWRDVDPGELRRALEIAGAAGSVDGRWVFYSKGGRYAPWWGNWQHVVDWSDEARSFYADNRTSNLLAERWWFEEGICYTDFGGSTFNARWMPPGCVFDMAGPAIFPHGDSQQLFALLAVLNSTPVRALLNAMNPSLHYQVRDLRHLPVPEWSDELEAVLAERARELVRGVQQVAALVAESPRSLGEPADEVCAREFVRRMPALERELDQMVCELYGCPELLAAQRPAHDYVRRLP